jgi:hypothetical protein
MIAKIWAKDKILATSLNKGYLMKKMKIKLEINNSKINQKN